MQCGFCILFRSRSLWVRCTFLLYCRLCVWRWLGRLLMIAGSFRRVGICSFVGSCMSFSTGRRQPEVKFTSYPRFPSTWSAVATLRRLCFAYFDIACLNDFRAFISFCLQFLCLVILKMLFYHFGAFTSDCQVFTHIFWTFLPPAWRWLLRPWLHETGTNSDRYDFRSVSIQMLVSVYIRPVWKAISCRFHSFRLLNRHEWLGPVWSRTTEPCKHERSWDQSKITVFSMRMSVVGPLQDSGKQQSLKKMKLGGFLGIQWLRIWLKHWKYQRPNMKVEVLTLKEIL